MLKAHSWKNLSSKKLVRLNLDDSEMFLAPNRMQLE